MASISYSFIWSKRRPWICQVKNSEAHLDRQFRNPTIIQRKHSSWPPVSLTPPFSSCFCHVSGLKGILFFNMTSLWSQTEAKRGCPAYHRGLLGLDFTARGTGAKHAWEQTESIHSQSVRFHCRRNSSVSQDAQVWHTLEIRSGSIFSAPALRQL